MGDGEAQVPRSSTDRQQTGNQSSWATDQKVMLPHAQVIGWKLIVGIFVEQPHWLKVVSWGAWPVSLVREPLDEDVAHFVMTV